MGKVMKKYNKKFDSVIPFTNKRFRRIVEFYLFKCPTPGKSLRAKTFEDYGFIGRNAFGKLKTNMFDKSVNLNKDSYFPCAKEELEEKLKTANNFEISKEYCVFLKHDEKTIMQSLYSAIRNAIAHGSFTFRKVDKKRMYYFENYDGYLKAEIRLYEETLLNWINLIESGFKD